MDKKIRDELADAFVLEKQFKENTFEPSRSFLNGAHNGFKAGFDAAIQLCESEKRKLKTACDESLQLYNEQVKNCKDVSFAYDELKQRERDLVEALEFYASESSWGMIQSMCRINRSDVEPGNMSKIVGGRRARLALNKHRGEK